jgi:hypothetical protein
MTGDPEALQADYVPLQPSRADAEGQPSVVVLPVPEPYGVRRISNVKIEVSLPDAVGAYIHWLINASGWKVAERAPAVERPVVEAIGSGTTMVAQGFSPASGIDTIQGHRFSAERARAPGAVQARHICLLFRRFVSAGEDALPTSRPSKRAASTYAGWRPLVPIAPNRNAARRARRHRMARR